MCWKEAYDSDDKRKHPAAFRKTVPQEQQLFLLVYTSKKQQKYLVRHRKVTAFHVINTKNG